MPDGLPCFVAVNRSREVTTERQRGNNRETERSTGVRELERAREPFRLFFIFGAESRQDKRLLRPYTLRKCAHYLQKRAGTPLFFIFLLFFLEPALTF
jgi:hypothetical protein